MDHSAVLLAPTGQPQPQAEPNERSLMLDLITHVLSVLIKRNRAVDPYATAFEGRR